MEQKDIVKNRMDELERQEKYYADTEKGFKTRQKIKKGIGTVFGILGGILLAQAAFGVIGIGAGLGFASVAVGSHLGAKNKTRERESKKQQIAAEKKHLSKVQSEGLKITPELNSKRVNRINNYKKQKQGVSSRRRIVERTSFLSDIALGFGLIGSCILTPGLGAFAAIATGLLKVKSSNDRAKLAEEDNRLALKLNNLTADMDIINKTPTARAAGEASEEKVVSKTDEKIDSKKVEKTENEELVEAYIDEMEKNPDKEEEKVSMR